MKPRLSPRLSLVIITLIFVLPLAAAWLMYSGAIEFQPVAKKNLGQLVQPPVPVDSGKLVPIGDTTRLGDELKNHWGIILDIPGDCQEECLQVAASLRQVHRASGRNQSRVRLLVLVPEDSSAALVENLRAIYPSFLLAVDSDGDFRTQLNKIAAEQVPGSDAGGGTFLLDPLGNIMMYYEAGSDPNHLKKDLKRLLTWSKLDEQ